MAEKPEDHIWWRGSPIWWLSYARGRVPLGVCLVRAPTFLAAVERARVLGISLGWSVQGFEAPPEEERALEPYLDRQLSVGEAEALGGLVVVAGEEPS